MKNFVLFLFFLFGSLAHSQNWNTDFETSKKTATEKGEKILLVFSGSDWCAPCIKLDKNVWQSPEFISFAEANLVLHRADFPKKKQNSLPEKQKAENNILAEKYNKEGFFPLVLILDNEGKVLMKKGYENQTAEEYISMLKMYLK